jgi:hypothetical protein
MSNKEQTAVEWLAKELLEKYHLKIDEYKEFKQAKAMHKEETCQFVSDYLDDAADYGMTAEEYYNQIYGGNNG